MNTSLWRPTGGTRPKRYRVIKNSEVIMVGDFIIDESTGVADVDATSEKILGFCTAVCTPDKISFESPSVTTGSYGGTWAASTKQYTAAADNVTVDGILAEYVPIREGDQLRVTLSGAKGTTTGSNKPGYFMSIDTSNAAKVLETSAATSAASCQFRVVDGYTQGSTTEVIVECIARQTSQFTMD